MDDSHDDVDGKSLAFALEKEVSKSFLELALLCKAVICCALVVVVKGPLFTFFRSCVAVTKGTCGQARQEEPKLDLACHRGWCQ